MLIIFLFSSSVKSSNIFENLLKDLYEIEFKLITGCRHNPYKNLCTIDRKTVTDIENTLKTGILHYDMIFSKHDKVLLSGIYQFLDSSINRNKSQFIILTEAEYHKLDHDLEHIRNALMDVSVRQKDALKTFFTLLILMISILIIIIIVIIGNIEKEKRHHQYQIKLAKSITRMENRIHNILSSELHDDIGQMLVFMKYKLNGNNSDLSRDIDETINKVRNLSYNLKIPDFSDGQFAPKVEELISRFSAISLIKVEYSLSNLHDELYPDHFPIMIFRIIQECLQNAIKHSKATIIKISLIESSPFLIYQYKDNGRGIIRADNNHVVLKSIEERAKLLNASIQINTGENKGLHIMMKIPFSEGIRE